MEASSKEIQIFGERIRTLRIDAKLSLQQLADHLNLSKQGLAKIEKGNVKSINEKYLEFLKSYFHCTKDYLLGYSDNPELAANGKRVVIFKDHEANFKKDLMRKSLRNFEFIKACIECDEKLTTPDIDRLHAIMETFLEKFSRRS